jgi:hypothetical protein
MKAFLASILTVIAMGVLAIAYGVLSPRMAAADVYSSARPMLASDRIGVVDDGTGLYNYPNNGMARYASNGAIARPAVYETYTPAPRRVTTTRRAVQTSSVERAPGRDWKKTALVIGGTTATGAGLGAIFGGKKGALIGAAIGGGASSIYEARKR